MIIAKTMVKFIVSEVIGDVKNKAN